MTVTIHLYITFTVATDSRGIQLRFLLCMWNLNLISEKLVVIVVVVVVVMPSVTAFLII